MKIKDISFKKIQNLINSCDPDLEISSISFVNGDYVLNLSQSLSNLQSVENDLLRAELQRLIKIIDEKENSGS